METSAILSPNITENLSDLRPLDLWITLAITISLILIVFLFFVALLLHAFFTITHMREQLRYILFTYILINNTINLLTCVLLFFFTLFLYKIPAGGCCFVLVIATCTFYNTPNGLAAMSIERYVAICFPLRYSQICRAERSWVVILLVSGIGILTSFFDILILSSSVDSIFFFKIQWCLRQAVFIVPQQKMMRYSTDVFNFTVVAVIILYTYVKIVQEAKKIGGDKASSSKASKTVLLHAIQLLLCLTSFTAEFSERLIKRQNFFIRLFNLFFFIVLPIFLIPLIYGVRDEVFRKHIKMFLKCPYHRCNHGGQ